jgi:hypothetical protein
VKHTPAFFLSARRGGAINGLLVTLSILGALTVGTIFVAPQYLAAQQPQALSVIAAGNPTHQALIDNLAIVVEQSVGVLAIHPRGATPYEEVVLWLLDNDDSGAPGRADEAELAVLSHSSVLHTVTVYQMTGHAAAGSFGVSRTSAEFCRRWRADERVKSVVLGRGVANMRIEPVGEQQDQWGESGQWGALQRLRLTLTWGRDSVDGADEASVLVDTVLFPSGAEP